MRNVYSDPEPDGVDNRVAEDAAAYESEGLPDRLLNAREVAKRMANRQRGTILFTGATAGMRGAAGFAAFAGAKHGIRALAQSMARELGPMNIHVAHIVVDGAIDTDFIRESFPDKYALKDQDGILNPEHIAENYWYLHSQPRDAWTFELDLRPWSERW